MREGGSRRVEVGFAWREEVQRLDGGLAELEETLN